MLYEYIIIYIIIYWECLTSLQLFTTEMLEIHIFHMSRNTHFHNYSKFPVKILKNKTDIISLRMRLLKFPREKLQEIEAKQSRELAQNTLIGHSKGRLYFSRREVQREASTGTCNPHFTAKYFCNQHSSEKDVSGVIRISRKKVEKIGKSLQLQRKKLTNLVLLNFIDM